MEESTGGARRDPRDATAKELKVMVGFLEKARPFADAPQQEILVTDRLLRDRRPRAFRAYNIAWVKHETPVDAILASSRRTRTRAAEGAFEGIVTSSTAHQRLQKDSPRWPVLEDRAPGRGLQAQRVQRPDRQRRQRPARRGRLRSHAADRREPAERGGDPRALRQQERVVVNVMTPITGPRTPASSRSSSCRRTAGSR